MEIPIVEISVVETLIVEIHIAEELLLGLCFAEAFERLDASFDALRSASLIPMTIRMVTEFPLRQRSRT